jgi:aspartate/methionine/tyrosine aminotransferase
MQSAVVEALKAPASWYEGMNRVYRTRRELAGQIMDELGCRYDENQVGLFLWGKIPDTVKDGVTLADKVLYDSHVFITPGFIFGSAGDRYIRISLCCKEEQLAEALERIKCNS